MTAKTITVLNPTARPDVKDVAKASRFDDLDGKVVGLLWNRKPNGDILLEGIKEVLLERFNLSGVEWRQKEGVACPASSDTIDELARTCDLIITATGD